jgi:hypothetical protein
MTSLLAGAALAGDAPALWQALAADPTAHPNLPFVALAGAPQAAWPEPQRFDARAHGLVADDGVSDDDALERAMTAARAHLAANPAGRAVVELPAGVIDLQRPVWLDVSGIGLVGAGSGHTTVRFDRPLSAWMISARSSDETHPWSYRGGMIWVEDAPREAKPIDPGIALGTAAEGAVRIPVDPATAAALTSYVGAWVTIKWTGGQDLMRHIYGHAASYPEQTKGSWGYIRDDGAIRYEAANRLLAVADGMAVLWKPLRLPIRPEWKVRLGRRSGEITRVSIAGLRIVFPPRPPVEHLTEAGYNAVFLRCAVDCTISDLAVEHADNGVILERTSHATVTGLGLDGGFMHHAVSLRELSHDNLVDGFTCLAPVQHGLSVQDLSSGNVFTRGTMRFGTFDRHRGLPFDNLWTEITLTAQGSGGGASGLYAGRRTAHWNITVVAPTHAVRRTKTATEVVPADPLKPPRVRGLGAVGNPEQLAMGALVGVRGVPAKVRGEKPWAIPAGDKGTIVVDWDVPIEPANLFDAQRKAWQGSDAQR